MAVAVAGVLIVSLSLLMRTSVNFLVQEVRPSGGERTHSNDAEAGSLVLNITGQTSTANTVISAPLVQTQPDTLS